ncbi:MAG: PAS domain S-box protein [Pontiellaceae bacterium]|nr:PAS domain S-box protein [Pontiellaceae bacterium]
MIATLSSICISVEGHSVLSTGLPLNAIAPLFSDKQIITILFMVSFLLLGILFYLVRMRSGLEVKTQALKKSDLCRKTISENLPKRFLFQLIYEPPTNQFKFTFISNRYERVLRLDRNVLLDNAALALKQVHPDDLPLLQKTFDEARERLEPASIEIRVFEADKTLRRLHVSAIPQYCDGTLVWDGFMQDITDAKRSEHHLAEEHQNFRQLFSAMEEFLIVCDPTGRILHTNPAVGKRLGYSAAELSGMHLFDLYPDDAQPEIRSVLEQLRSTSSGSCSQSLQMKSGAEIMVEMNLFQGTWERQPALIGVAHDIARYRQVESALRESRRILQLIIDSIPMSVFWKDRDSVYLGCNTTFIDQCRLCSHSDVIGKTPLDLFEEATALQVIEQDQEIISSNQAQMKRLKRYVHPDEKAGWREISTVPLRNTKGQAVGVLGIWNDITERKNAEDKLQETLKTLERFNQLMRKREIRTLELKAEVNHLCAELEWPQKYRTTIDRVDDDLQLGT